MTGEGWGWQAVANPLAGSPETGSAGAGTAAGTGTASDEVLAFHRRLPGYAPTPLVSLPRLAERLGLGALLAKCESTRFDLPAFKMLGASWATYRALRERLGELGLAADLEPWRDIDDLATRVKPLLPCALAAATDGNHGRAVARMARLLGLGARIFVPEGTTRGRIEGIESEGAEVVVVAGGYDAAVARSAEEAGPRCLVVSDTSWDGYTDVPRWVIDGYSTMFREIEDALSGPEGRSHRIDAVVVPIGVGALGAAAVNHYKTGTGPGPLLFGVEPTDAACVTASALAGKPVTLDGAQRSIMAGLNCGTPSVIAWPYVARGFDGYVTIGDEWARDAVRDLAAAGIEAGETGAAALGGLTALCRQGRTSAIAGLLPPDASVLVLVTEGASDPAAWRSILGVETVGKTAAG